MWDQLLISSAPPQYKSYRTPRAAIICSVLITSFRDLQDGHYHADPNQSLKINKEKSNWGAASGQGSDNGVEAFLAPWRDNGSVGPEEDAPVPFNWLAKEKSSAEAILQITRFRGRPIEWGVIVLKANIFAP